ncbi:MAG: transposase [Muribaculaceae bacterium]|nr:transposase [Muribaculaceae bacterium]
MGHCGFLNGKAFLVVLDIGVETCHGFLLGRHVSSAGIYDSRLASPVCEQVSDAWPSVRKGLVDRGYRGELIENIKRHFNIDNEVCSTPNGTNGFTPKPIRWAVERTFAWLDGFRRLARNYEITNESAEEMIDFTTLKLLLNHVEL